MVHLVIDLQKLAAEEDSERLDKFTRQLLLEMREHDVSSAELVRGQRAPPGTKGVIEVAMAIALGITTNAFWDVAKVLVSRLRTRPGVVIRLDGTVADGHVKFEGTPAELASLLERLSSQSRTASTEIP